MHYSFWWWQWAVPVEKSHSKEMNSYLYFPLWTRIFFVGVLIGLSVLYGAQFTLDIAYLDRGPR